MTTATNSRRRRRLTSMSEVCAGTEEEKVEQMSLSDDDGDHDDYGYGYGYYDNDDDEHDYNSHLDHQRRQQHQQQQQQQQTGHNNHDEFQNVGQTALQQKLETIANQQVSLSLRGGVRGGHSVSSHSSQSQTLQQPPPTASALPPSPPPPTLGHPGVRTGASSSPTAPYNGSGTTNHHHRGRTTSSPSSSIRDGCAAVACGSPSSPSGQYDPNTGCCLLDPTEWPKGLTNVGNTCYANAALQCLLSTALTSALMDPKAVPILRRYSSNPNLLAQGSGSVDSEDEVDILPGGSPADGLMRDQDKNIKMTDKNKNKKKIKSRSGVISGNGDPCRPSNVGMEEDETTRKERERRKMEEKCQWLTQELTSITHEYMEDTPSPSSSGPASSGTGFSSGLPLYGGRSSMISGWSILSSSTNSPSQDNNNNGQRRSSMSGVVNPGTITRHPERLSKCLRPYQQEDAHEFMRALLSTLVMNGHNRQLSSLFDGLLESSVTCKTCGRASLTRDRYMDLSLDINDPDVSTLDDALYDYTKTEVLADENSVFCQKCRKKRTVTKGLRLATAPSILVCHLKRFAFDAYGRLVRLHKRVEFPQQLEIGEFMSDLNKARPPPYELVGVLVHQGQTCASGHYLSFVKKNGEWFKCNDSEVTKVAENIVMMQQAYILIYEVAEMRKNPYFTNPGPVVRKEMSFMQTIESDDAEMSKDEASAHASHWSSSENTASKRSHNANARNFHKPRRPHPDTESPAESIIRLLRDVGVTHFISDLCCDSTNLNVDEPATETLTNKRSGRIYTMNQNHSSQHSRASGKTKSSSGRRRRRHDSYAHECESVDTQDSLIRRQALMNSGSVNVLEVERKRPANSHRAQTAPRQRLNSEPAFNDVVAPFATYTPRAGPTPRKFNSYGGDSGGESSTHTGTTASTNRSRRRDRNKDSSRGGTNTSERLDLPPLMPPNQKGNSSSSSSQKNSTRNID
mmetsp:Transcript_29505/g.71242  ORF Transcript_29505/g.71242 Transcript_29505/m.71242 type:complete len:967 (-) Transcript_29505:50-2950(-)